MNAVPAMPDTRKKVRNNNGCAKTERGVRGAAPSLATVRPQFDH